MTSSKARSTSILLTGTPGTGKTSLAHAWCEKSGWTYLSLNDMVEEKKLYSGIDKNDGAKIVKLEELEQEANLRIQSLSPSPVLIEGHLGCEIKLEVQRVLVLRLQPDELSQRLNSRPYSPSKLMENKMAEMLDYCTLRSETNYGKKKVFEINGTGKTLKQNLEEFEKFVLSGEPDLTHPASISWSAELRKAADSAF